MEHDFHINQLVDLYARSVDIGDGWKKVSQNIMKIAKNVKGFSDVFEVYYNDDWYIRKIPLDGQISSGRTNTKNENITYDQHERCRMIASKERVATLFS